MPRAAKAKPVDLAVYVEELAQLFESGGRLPRIAARIYALLLACDEESLDQQQLAERLSASSGSVSGMTRMLLERGLIERVPLPGSRRDNYRLASTGVLHDLRFAAESARGYAAIAGRGLDLPAASSSARTERLRTYRDQWLSIAEVLEAAIRLRVVPDEPTRLDTG
jgi:hypothetical protein